MKFKILLTISFPNENKFAYKMIFLILYLQQNRSEYLSKSTVIYKLVIYDHLFSQSQIILVAMHAHCCAFISRTIKLNLITAWLIGQGDLLSS